MDSSLPAASSRFSITEKPLPEISIIIPARNEETSLAACLESLNTQTGVPFETIVVDDASTDRTREIAQSCAGVRVISAGTLPPAGNTWGAHISTGKNNALVAGAREARAPWLLFTDADTVHQPHSLERALAEAKKEQADLLSYSPEQIVVTFAERAVMPVIFAELAAQYPPQKVRDKNSNVIAANGQYILVRRAAYDAAGGHAAIATEILEDVALARQFRDAGFKVYFRYGADAVRTRMYRNWPQLCEGWTKNLALLFPRSGTLALRTLFFWALAWVSFSLAVYGANSRRYLWIALALLWLLVYRRIRAANFAIANNLLAIAMGLPVFAYLLLRSKQAHASGRVSWKGRTYNTAAPSEATSAPRPAVKSIPGIEKHELRAEN
ncbi:MAG: glycosyltransferase family 2 protein [Terriglobales bacterium]